MRDTAELWTLYRPSFSSLVIDLLFQVPTRLLAADRYFPFQNRLKNTFPSLPPLPPPNLSIPRPILFCRYVLLKPSQIISISDLTLCFNKKKKTDTGRETTTVNASSNDEKMALKSFQMGL
jgi:hypothetical protein